MRLKLAIIALYGLALAVPALWSVRSFASTDLQSEAQNVRDVKKIDFDVDDRNGRRGLVRFNHKLHEGLLNPYPNFPHKTLVSRPGSLRNPSYNIACIGCHHKAQAPDGSHIDTIQVSDITQYRYQKCTTCHKEEGNPENPASKDSWIEGQPETGIDLNSRDAFHRLCISCHQKTSEQEFKTSSDLLKAERPEFRNVSGIIKFTKCAECHDRAAPPVEVARVIDEQPPPYEQPEGPLTPMRRPPRSEIFTTPIESPLGYAGPSTISNGNQTSADAVPMADRWRIGYPDDPRFKTGQWYNPYNQNVLKGDYPILKQHNFMILTLESETFINARRIPVGSNLPTQRPDSNEFFGRGGQIFTRQNFVASIEFFHGDAAFKPIDYRFRFTPNFNINYLNTQENVLVNIDPRRGANRIDGYVGFQELFGEVRLGDTTKLLPFLRGKGSKKGESPFFDVTFLRVGIQQFNSDFRGLIFNDFNLGARLFGQAANNRYNFNAIYFYQLEKDTNSELNTRVNLGEFRDQTLFIANVYRQDTKYKGYTFQGSFHYNHDRASTHFDENDFPVRPALIGVARPHAIKAYYYGFTGDGHMGRLNINHAFYQVLGHDTFNPIARRRVDINAQMAAAELSVDRDWLRFKGSVFWSSGDKDPFDDTAKGFDTILDTPEFVGGKNSYWVSQGIPLVQTGVFLTQPDSIVPNLRSSKIEGQANFVNPGIFIYNFGLEAEITPKLRGIANLNYLHFHHTETLQGVYGQGGIRRDIGTDYGFGILYRPLLSENWIISAGYNALIPGTGFKDIYSSNCGSPALQIGPCGADTKYLQSAYVKLKFTY